MSLTPDEAVKLAVEVELLERVEAREVIISAFGLREGLLLEMIGEQAPDPKQQDPLRLAREFVERHHYSRSYPAARRRFGLYRGGELEGVGVAVRLAPRDDALVVAGAGGAVAHREHRLAEQPLDALFVGPEALNAVLAEAAAGAG